MNADQLETFDIHITSLMIRPGMYSVSYALTSEDCKDRLLKAKDAAMLKVTGPSNILSLRSIIKRIKKTDVIEFNFAKHSFMPMVWIGKAGNQQQRL